MKYITCIIIVYRNKKWQIRNIKAVSVSVKNEFINNSRNNMAINLLIKKEVVSKVHFMSSCT